MQNQCDCLRQSNLQLREEILRLERENAELKKEAIRAQRKNKKQNNKQQQPKRPQSAQNLHIAGNVTEQSQDSAKEHSKDDKDKQPQQQTDWDQESMFSGFNSLSLDQQTCKSSNDGTSVGNGIQFHNVWNCINTDDTGSFRIDTGSCG